MPVVRQMAGGFAQEEDLAILILALSLMTRLGDAREGLMKGGEDVKYTAA